MITQQSIAKAISDRLFTHTDTAGNVKAIIQVGDIDLIATAILSMVHNTYGSPAAETVYPASNTIIGNTSGLPMEIQLTGELNTKEALTIINNSLELEADLRKTIDDFFFKHFGNDGLEPADSLFTKIQTVLYPASNTIAKVG